MSFFRRKKKPLPPRSGESIIGEHFVKAVASAGLTARSCLARPGEPNWPLSGKSALLAMGDSNVPIAALVPLGEQVSLMPERLETLFRTWLALIFPNREGDCLLIPVALEGNAGLAFRWTVMEGEPFILTDERGREIFALWLRTDIWGALNGREDSSAFYQGRHRKDHYDADRNLDLPLFESFFATAFRSPSSRYSAVLRGFGPWRTQNSGPSGEAAQTWYKGSFEYLPTGHSGTPPVLTFVYAYPAAEGESTDVLASAFFSESVRSFLSSAACAPGRVGFKRLDTGPDLDQSGPLLVFDIDIRGNSTRQRVNLYVQASVLTPLSLASGVPAESGVDPLRRLFSLNFSRLSVDIGGILRRKSYERTIPRFCVSELLALLSTRDYALVLQNVLLPVFGAKGLCRILFHTDNPAASRPLPYGPLDGPRLEELVSEAFLPEFFREVAGLKDNGREECDTLNRTALRTIHQFLKEKRIIASRRLSYLLETTIVADDREASGKTLRELREADIPFGRLRSLKPGLAQTILAEIDDRHLALALVDAESETDWIRTHISAGRLLRLREDIGFQKNSLARGDLETDAVVKAKKLIEATVQKEIQRSTEP